ncbi:hypothetical protein MWU75_15785 [Ornithinimicrobium sp. F0845]|uniref:hypothetical protein n=1 Tax=Ornithinimicrobium sp. F0845 TaxID=2926412 RepID=UPI001FF13363|nr:hypothetical protein [Ornithinimicrobium sp. F0845]MCK0113607.1 hypothetical protein [Ornithinimicrobium sp. F0845]
MTITTPTRPHTLVRPNRHTAASPDWTYHALVAQRPVAPAVRPGTVRLLVDLTSPWAYLAHLRLGPDDDSSWLAVQRPTTIPRTGLRDDGPEREEMQRQLDAARSVAGPDEDLPTRVPSVLPHPRTVAAAYAEAVDLGRGAAVRAVLLEAYWLDGQDIGSPDVLRQILPSVVVDEDTLCTGDPRREFGYLVSPAREPLTDRAYHLMADWQRQWEDLGRPGPLALVDTAGAVRTGPAALRP